MSACPMGHHRRHRGDCPEACRVGLGLDLGLCRGLAERGEDYRSGRRRGVPDHSTARTFALGSYLDPQHATAADDLAERDSALRLLCRPGFLAPSPCTEQACQAVSGAQKRPVTKATTCPGPSGATPRSFRSNPASGTRRRRRVRRHRTQNVMPKWCRRTRFALVHFRSPSLRASIAARHLTSVSIWSPRSFPVKAADRQPSAPPIKPRQHIARCGWRRRLIAGSVFMTGDRPALRSASSRGAARRGAGARLDACFLLLGDRQFCERNFRRKFGNDFVLAGIDRSRRAERG